MPSARLGQLPCGRWSTRIATLPPAAAAAHPVAVTLHGDDPPWRPVSPRLARVRLSTSRPLLVPQPPERGRAVVVLPWVPAFRHALGAARRGLAVGVVALWSAW